MTLKVMVSLYNRRFIATLKVISVHFDTHPAALKISKKALSWCRFSTNRMHVFSSHTLMAAFVALMALGMFSESTQTK